MAALIDRWKKFCHLYHKEIWQPAI